MAEIVFGLRKILLVSVTGQAERGFVVLLYKQQVFLYLIIMHLMAGLADYFSIITQSCSLLYQFLRYLCFDRLYIDHMEVVPFAFLRENVFIGVAFNTERRVAGALDQKAFIRRAMHCVAGLADDMLTGLACFAAPFNKLPGDLRFYSADRMITFFRAAVLICMTLAAHR